MQRRRSLPRLDFAILNAGLLRIPLNIIAATRHEETILIKYLLTALLVILLLPVVGAKRTNVHKPRRIALVASEMGERAKFKENKRNAIIPTFNNPKYFDRGESYFPRNS